MPLTYHPLSPSHSEIRLLKFTSPPPSSSPTLEVNPISLTLHRTPLSPPPPEYHALSYVWGDPTLTTPITVDGTLFSVTINLAAALRILQHSNLGGGFFWIDAICINQDDMAERATQVKLMGRIYKEAYGVLAWLGEESGMVAHARPAFALMKAFAGAVREVARMVGGEVGEEEVLARAQMEDLLIVAVVFSAAVEELVRQGVSVDGSQKAMVEVFFTNAYWKRCWTFQEMYLADYGTLLCGMQTLSMQDAWTVHKWFRQAGRAILANARPEGVSDQAWWILQDMEDVLGGLPLFSSMRIKETVASGGNGFAAYFRDSEDLFATLLLTSLEREATYPRDRFYSLMGVCKPAINIDYVAPDEDVFVEVTAAPLRGGRISASFVLEFAGFTAPKGAYALSSWVPNWDISLLKSSPDSGRAHNLTDADAGFPGPRFRPVINGLTARFQGTFIDSIARVQAGWDGIPTGCILDESAPPTLDIARHLLDEMAKFFFDCPPGAFMLELVPSSKPYAGGGTRFLALLRYWTHDMKLYRKPFECVITRDLNSEDVVRLAKQFLMFVGLRPWDMDRIMALGRPAGSRTSDNFLTKLGEKGYTWDDVLLALPTDEDPAIIDFLLSQVLPFQAVTRFRTGDGVIGHARNGIQPGDMVCVLNYCDTPMVLRPRSGEGNYDLVSPAFVIGMMNGEASRLVERGERIVSEMVIH